MYQFDLPTWLENDAPKIRDKPGLVETHKRMLMAAEALNAVLVVHAGCKAWVCPTVSAYQRVLLEHGYRGEARFGEIAKGIAR